MTSIGVGDAVYVESLECWGKVEAIDPPGLPAGVKVRLDEAVNGTTGCYATHSEIVAETDY